MNTNKPELNPNISVQDFIDFYWLKKELTTFCKSQGIDISGGKIEIKQRIIQFLETGKITKKKASISKSFSKFDWNKEELFPHTIITDNYKNTENVRTFFKKQIGEYFHFSVDFMNWMKTNEGKLLSDAISEWKRLSLLKKDKNYQTEISPQFEYNKYMRAFLADNPDKTSKEAMKFWNLKKTQRGSMEYNQSDLNLENV